jgi:hypothetical protein
MSRLPVSRSTAEKGRRRKRVLRIFPLFRHSGVTADWLSQRREIGANSL